MPNLGLRILLGSQKEIISPGRDNYKCHLGHSGGGGAATVHPRACSGPKILTFFPQISTFRKTTPQGTKNDSYMILGLNGQARTLRFEIWLHKHRTAE